MTYNILNLDVSEFIKTLKISMYILRELFLKKHPKWPCGSFTVNLDFCTKKQASPFVPQQT